MTWPAVFAAFLVCHLTGDLILQTEWQALTKVQGLGTPEGRRALALHGATYMIAFVPALIWVAAESTPVAAVGVAALVAIPHLLLDDGHFVRAWLRHVKHAGEPAPSLALMVDQSFHVVCLLGAALLATS